MFFKNGEQEVFQLTEKVPSLTWIAVRKWAIITGHLLIVVIALAVLILGLLLPVSSPTDAIIFAVILLSAVVVCVFSLMFTTKLEQRRKAIFAGMDREHFVTSDHHSYKLLFDPRLGTREWMQMQFVALRIPMVRDFLRRVDISDADKLSVKYELSFTGIVTQLEAKTFILLEIEGFVYRGISPSGEFIHDQRMVLADELSKIIEDHDDVFRRAYDVQTQLEKGVV